MSVSRDYPRNRPRLLPRRRQTGTELDLKDLQGNLVRGYTYPVGAYVFVGISDAARRRARGSPACSITSRRPSRGEKASRRR